MPHEEAPNVVHLDRLADPHNLGDLVRGMENCLSRTARDRHSAVWIVLSFAAHDADPSRSGREIYLNTATATLMSALLLSERYRDLPLEIRLPTGRADLLQLARSGVLFAAAQRPGPTRVTALAAQDRLFDLVGDELSGLQEWKGRWSHVDKRFRRCMLEQSAETPTADERADEQDAGRQPPGPSSPARVPLAPLVQDRFVTFLNPHRSSRTRVNNELTHNLVEPWLARLIGPPPAAADWTLPPLTDERLPDVRAYSQTVDELLDNLCDYAFEDSACALSYLQLYTTKGGRRSADRLHMSVLDNGLGILTTLRPKLVGRLEAEYSDEQLLDELLHGGLRYARGRGRGLAYIAELAADRRGSALIATSCPSGGALIAQLRRGAWSIGRVDWLPLQGTLAVLTLELEQRKRVAPDEGEDLLLTSALAALDVPTS